MSVLYNTKQKTMKKLLLLFLLSVSFTVSSQISKRVKVDGKIIVEHQDVNAITVFNTSTKKGVITNEKGEFAIEVGLNDLIEFRALQYQNFDLQVSEAIIISYK